MLLFALLASSTSPHLLPSLANGWHNFARPPAAAVSAPHYSRRARPIIAAAAPDDDDDVDDAGAGPLLFLVDDQPGMRSAVERYLSHRGFRCRTFESAPDALRAIARSTPPPDALVTDVLMPGGMDGLDLLRAVRADVRLCAVPVVLLTAKGLTSDRIAGYDAGCSAYVAKPFDPEELVAVLRALTSNALLARAALLGTEVTSLRTELANTRHLLQTMLQVGGSQAGGAAAVARTLQPASPADGAAAASALEAAALLPGVAPPSSAASSAQGDVKSAMGAAVEHVPALTQRERDVLDLVGEGMLNKEIAARLGIGLRYVEKIIKQLLEKTDTTNRTALVRRALQLGYLSLDDGDGGPR